MAGVFTCTVSVGPTPTRLLLRAGFRVLVRVVARELALHITFKRNEKKKRSKKFVCWLVASRPSNRLVYLWDGSAQTLLRAATLR